MKKLVKTIMAKSKGILRSISTGLSNGVLEAINGNVQAAKRKAIDEFWTDLPADLRATYEKQALNEADSIARRLLKRDDVMGKAVRQGLLDKFALKMMAAG